MATKDYYETLGVSRTATIDDIKQAYKRLAKKYHPDLNKNSDATEKFKEINEAASVLSDEKKREQYDRFGTAEGTEGGFQGFDFRDFGFGFDVDDLFETFFGGRGRQRGHGAQRGADLEYDLEITLEEAAFGAEKHIALTHFEICGHCHGSRAESSDDVIPCADCGGSGVYRRQQRTPFGIFQSTTPCGKCRGEGTSVKKFCHECHGEGRIKKHKQIAIAIPKGVHDGSKLRVAGEGEAGSPGAPAGDLYVNLYVQEHDIFERREYDVYLQAPITFIQACLGAEIEVPTLSGKAQLKIPPATQTNTVFRLKGEGIPHLRGYGKGDELVKVIVQTPKKLSKTAKQLLETLDKELEKEPGFFDRIKDAF